MTTPAAQLPGLPPGPELAAALAEYDPDTLPATDAVMVLRAWSRQRAHDHARLARTIARVAALSRTAGAGRTEGDWAGMEIAAALTWTDATAGRELDFAETLVVLPLVMAAFDAGQLDHGKAWVFTDILGAADLTDVQVEKVCTWLVPLAPRLTAGQLRHRLLRAVLAVDPDYALRRYRRALSRACVHGYLTADGSAVITATGLPADEAAAACARVDGLAEQLRRCGHPGSINQIRARAFVQLLDGRLTGLTHDQIVAALLSDPPADNDPHTSDGETATEGSTTEGSTTEGSTTGRHAVPPDPARAASCEDDDTEDDDTEDDDTEDDHTEDDSGQSCASGTDAGSGGAASARDHRTDLDDAARPMDLSHLAEPADLDDLDACAATGSGVTAPPADTTPGAIATLATGAAAAAAGRDPRPPDDPGAPDPESSRPTPTPSGRRPPARGPAGVEIRVGLLTLLGFDVRPGEIPGFGPVLPDTARALAARQHAGEWRYALLDDYGCLLLAGTTPHRPATGAVGPAANGGTAELHVTVRDLTALDPADHPAWSKLITHLLGQWEQRDRLRALLDAHPDSRFARGSLARHVQIRDRACVAPGCRRPAMACQLDHTLDHARGGVTTRANTGPLCARHHLLKHEGGWRLDQPGPGRFRWISPLGQVHDTRGEPIAPPMPEPITRAGEETPPDPAGPVILPGPSFDPRPPPTVTEPPPRPHRISPWKLPRIGDPDDPAPF